MKKIMTLATALLLMLPAGELQAQDNVNIGKSNIKLTSRMMTPEALWAMGRIGTVEASPDGSRVVYQVGYYSVKQNKSHQVLYVVNADGTGQQLLTTGSKNETDPAWLDGETIAFISGGEVWSMKADGTQRRQLSNTKGEQVSMKYDNAKNTFTMDRKNSGDTSFSEAFPAVTVAPVAGDIRQLRIFIDKCSIEVLDAEGRMAMTNLVFPAEPYSKLTVKGGKATVYPLAGF